MNKKATIRPYASGSWARMDGIRFTNEDEYGPLPGPKRVPAGTRLFGRYDEDWEFDPVHDPELALDLKLDEAEFAVLHDTGPEGEAYRPGARLTYIEVQFMLKHESLAVNSLLVDVESQRRHRVLRGRYGRLVLEPPYAPRRRGGRKKPALRRAS